MILNVIWSHIKFLIKWDNVFDFCMIDFWNIKLIRLNLMHWFRTTITHQILIELINNI